MSSPQNIAEWQGKDLVDRGLEDVYFYVATEEPMFRTVKEGLIGRHRTFVPLAGIEIGPDDLQVTASRKQVTSAPTSDVTCPRGRKEPPLVVG